MPDFYHVECENLGSSVEFETMEGVLEEYLNEMREKEVLTTPYDVLDPSA